jgi:cytochrome c553
MRPSAPGSFRPQRSGALLAAAAVASVAVSGGAIGVGSVALVASVATGIVEPASTEGARVAAAAPDFDREIRPVLAARCFSCHGPDAESRKAGLRLDTFAGATAELEDGGRAIAPGDPGRSVLLDRVAATDLDDRMPPEGHEPLTTEEVDAMRRWIESGAEYTAPWAFRPLSNPSVPVVRDDAWPRGDIDRFALATRERAGLPAPAADAAPEALLRRASFDLVGLPPTEAEIRAFAADPSDARFAAFVDARLASPAFGERWGRHWLDLARYAETLAHEFDYEIPHAWRYRDYVVEALNADVPLGRFVTEQLAGDLVEPRAGLGLPNVAPIGTAWWLLGPATHAPVDVRVDEADRIAGAIDVAGRSFLSLSIACARCHDHKFDPVPARDYYALAGVARNTRRVEAFLDVDPNTPLLEAKARAALEEAARTTGAAAAPTKDIAPVEGVALVDRAERIGPVGAGGWSASGSAFRASGAPFALAADDRLRPAEIGTIDSARIDARLVGSARSPSFALDRKFVHVRLRGPAVWMRLIIDNYWLDDRNGLLFEGMRRRTPDASPEDAARDPRAWPWRVETFDVTRFQGERAYVELIDDGDGWVEVDAIATSDVSAPPDFAAIDGDGAVVVADGAMLEDERLRALAIEARDARDALVTLPAPVRALVAEDSGVADEPVHVRGSPRAYGEPAPRARLSFLASPGSIEGSGRLDLARSITDPEQPYLWRTTANRVWLKLFGRGIVETPDDFGQLGASPWSVGLLDHLARKLARGGSLKPLIREIVLSRAYRALPSDDEIPPAAWAPLAARRLDAEAIRDAMLVASGRLDATIGGPSVPVHLTEHMQGRGRPGVSGPIDGAGRRSVYIAVNRNFLDPFLQAFDQPPPATTCGKRHVSNVPAQALALLNNDMVREFARLWGERLAADGRDDAARVESMWFAAFARAPREDERALARAFLEGERAAVADPARCEQAAFAALAHALFSAKEFVFLR